MVWKIILGVFLVFAIGFVIAARKLYESCWKRGKHDIILGEVTEWQKSRVWGYSLGRLVCKKRQTDHHADLPYSYKQAQTVAGKTNVGRLFFCGRSKNFDERKTGTCRR